MTLRILTDENIDGDVISGVLRRGADVELAGAADPDILEWAANEGWILLTHDRKTVPRFARDRQSAKLPMTGVFMIPPELSLGEQIEDLVQIAGCSDTADWNGQHVYMPYFR